MTAPASFLAAARAIGMALLESAWWSADRQICNWLCRADDPLPRSPETWTAATKAMPSALADGAAGVALFLGELYAQTGEPEFGVAASAALRGAIRRARKTPEAMPAGAFYVGGLGLLFTASRLSDRELPVDADDLAWLRTRAAKAIEGTLLLDFMLGASSAVPVLLALARRPGWETYADLARQFGERILAAAAWNNDACSWDPMAAGGGGMTNTPLTGLSHGTAGFAVGLLALWERTGEPRWLDAARGAFAYEDRFYVADQKNWLDLRAPHTETNGENKGVCGLAWCHGAPGIALARLRGFQTDRERAPAYAETARAALETARAGLTAQLGYPRADTCYCHGVAGLAEILSIGGEVLGDDALRTAARDAAAVIVERHGGGVDWPSGLPSRDPTPVFWNGYGGVGYFLLRLAAPRQTPSLVLPLST